MKFLNKFFFVSIFTISLITFSSYVYAVTTPELEMQREATRGELVDVTVYLGKSFSPYYNILVQGNDGSNWVTKGSVVIICDDPNNPDAPECHSESNPSPGVTAMFTELDKDPHWRGADRIVTFTLNTGVAELPAGDYQLVLRPNPTRSDFRESTANLRLNQPPAGTVVCNARVVSMNTTDPSNGPYKVEATATGLSGNGQITAHLTYDDGSGGTRGYDSTKNIVLGSANFVFSEPTAGRIELVSPETYTFFINDPSGGATDLCQVTNIVVPETIAPSPSAVTVPLPKFCKSKSDPNFTAGDVECSKAAGQTCNVDGEPGILTAIGCVPTEPQAFINRFIRFAIFGAGGIALLLMIFGAIQMIASAGNPETLKKGQETFTAAIIGLLFIIFSTLLLQIIGVDILSLPGFGR